MLLPLWLQKGFGPWTTYGGVGWWRNPGPGNRDFLQYGWLLQRELAEGWSLGGELFHQDASGTGQRAYTTWNLGFEARLADHLQLVGSGGRIFARGLRNAVGIAFRPGSSDLFAVVNERDGLGDGLVPDYLTRLADGAYDNILRARALRDVQHYALVVPRH